MAETISSLAREVIRLAREVIRLAHDGILINMRFLDVALDKLKLEERERMGAFAFDGGTLYYDPALLLSGYRKEPHFMVRLYLHTLLHCIFYHSFQTGKLDRELWDLSTDIAVENTILDMNLHLAALPRMRCCGADWKSCAGRPGDSRRRNFTGISG